MGKSLALVIVLTPAALLAVAVIGKLLSENFKTTVFCLIWLGAWMYLTLGAQP